MNYLVVSPKAHGCEIRIVPDGTILDMPFESWALAEGKQILYTVNAMHRDLKQSYLWGSYQKGASYATEYFDMCQIVASRIGPCDRAKYEAKVLEQQKIPLPTKPQPKHENHWAEVLWSLLDLLLICTWGIMRLCAVLLIFPFVIRWMKGKRH